MQERNPAPDVRPPALMVADDEVVLHARGFAVLVAAFEAEGYYDETADGDPEEQDLYRIEVLDAAQAARAVEALEGEAAGPLQALGLTEPTLRRLFPATRWAAGPDRLPPVAHYLLALAHALREATGPLARQRLLEASAAWSMEEIEARVASLPPGETRG